ncbi:MAG: hypothetical protein II689_01280, partial [Firmicutes bacterium]|nr:hypothetical protein [Bacillota bacterium]
VLVLLVVSAFVMSWIARQDSGIVTAGIVCDKGDPASIRVAERLLRSESQMRFILFDSEEEARESLSEGRIDAVWVFPDMKSAAESFAEDGVPDEPVRVIEREDDPLLSLAREKLFAAIFPEISRAEFDGVMEERFGLTGETELGEYYDSTLITAGLIRFETVRGEENSQGYLISPLRGIVYVLILVAAFSSAIYGIGEVRRETFVWAGASARFIPLLSNFLASLGVGLAGIAAFYACDISNGIFIELGAVLALSGLFSAFCEVLRIILKSEERLSAAMAVLVTLGLVLVFV